MIGNRTEWLLEQIAQTKKEIKNRKNYENWLLDELAKEDLDIYLNYVYTELKLK